MKIKPIKALKVFFGVEEKKQAYPLDFESFHQNIIAKVRPYTMTSNERLYGLIEAIKYIIQNNIPGNFVECGVWKGGSMMAIAETLLQLGVTDRQLYLYDTFTGMTAPTKEDQDSLNRDAASQLKNEAAYKTESVVWAFSTLEEVKNNIANIHYPSANIHFIEGDILQTVPATIPQQIALLRLDTDWYASTKHEMIHLYPKLNHLGVLIIDDYGFWKGSRQAVDEYIQEKNIQILLNRMDDTGRIAIKIA
ncbi:TylF/MycF/NovP-related O-methyltransferase [Hydrotalea sp.]|uniref:TylF/MycF/NovP-related O-methyltransferase n=1 Tax=Hydrotalea sp. TaxID=2881279 RepID=UPI002615E4B2|nr:TylF/MycF/NovP-related O-methyltransferase [Hydrotalea sp.]